MRQAIQELQPQEAKPGQAGLIWPVFLSALMTLGSLLGVYQTFGGHTPGLLAPVLAGLVALLCCLLGWAFQEKHAVLAALPVLPWVILFAAAGPAATRAGLVEQAAEQVGESPGTAGAAVFKRGMAVLVIGPALVRITQDTVGLRRLLELFFRHFITGIQIRMIFFCQFSVRVLQSLIIRISVYSEHLIIIAFLRHCLNS